MGTKLKDFGIPLITALMGGFFGFLGQHWSTERAIYLERLQHVHALRTQAYVNFFEAGADLNQAREFGIGSYAEYLSKKETLDPELNRRLEPAIWDYQTKMKKARFMLAATASAPVVSSLAKYYRQEFPSGPAPGSWRTDVETYLNMRRELLKDIDEQEVLPADAYLLLFNADPMK